MLRDAKGRGGIRLAQLLIKRGPVKAATRQENTLQDWNGLLHSIWLQIMAANPGLYDDATIPHLGTCPCKCTGNLYLREGHEKK